MTLEGTSSSRPQPDGPRVLLVSFPSGGEPLGHPAATALIGHLRERGASVHLFKAGYGKPVAFADLRVTSFPPPPALHNIDGIVRGLAQQEAYRGFGGPELLVQVQFQVYRDYPAFDAAVRTAVAEADVVVLDRPYLGRIVGPICREAGKPLLILAHEALFQARTTNPRSQKLLRVNEVEALRCADQVLFASQQDRQAFAAHGVAGEVGGTAEAFGAAVARLAGKPLLAAPRQRGLVLLEHTLKIIHGHFFNYAKSISDAAARAGMPFRVFGAVGLVEEISSQIDAVPVFRHGFLDPYFRHPEPETPEAAQMLHDFMAANIEFHNDLVRALPLVRSDDVLLMANMDHRQLLAWSWLLDAWPAELCPSVVLLFRYTYYRATGRPENDGLALDTTHRFAAQSLAALEKAARGKPGKVRLVTDSEGLAEEYRQWTSLPVEIVPIPHTVAPHVERGASLLPPKQAGRLRFITLGDAREEKGIPLLTLALRHLVRRPEFAEMEFLLQAFIGNPFHAAMGPFLDELRRIAGEHPNLTLVDRALDEAGYHELLTSADVVLVPYQRTSYFSRTSGIFTEAIANGKPVVVTEGTWMSGQLGDSGAGVLFADGSPEKLAEAILAAHRDFAKLRANVLRMREGYLGYHNPDAFLQAIVAPAPKVSVQEAVERAGTRPAARLSGVPASVAAEFEALMADAARARLREGGKRAPDAPGAFAL